MQLTQTMAPFNNMTVVTKGPLNINSRTRAPRERMIQAIWVNDLDPGTIYIEHCNWLDFRRYQLKMPIYINLVRDPVDRMVSWFYYVRSSYRNAIFFRRFPNATIKSESWFKKNYNDCVRNGDPECQYIPGSVIEAEGNYKRQTLFFCGHNRECLPFDSHRAIQLAKINVERDYAVVGTWEETNITLAVLEAYIPRFFKGARQIFERRITVMNLNNTRFARLEVVVFNRPTRVQSEEMLPLFRHLAAMNDINVVLNGPIRTMNRTRTEQEQVVEIDWTSEMEKGSIYMAHSNWLDFKGFGYNKPIYASLVRDPIDRMVADYYKRRSWTKRMIYRKMYPGRTERPEKWYKQSFNQCVRSGDPECRYIQHSVKDYIDDFKRQSLYFCGNDPDCLPFNSPHAIQMAKQRVEKEYSVVGTWEEKNITLTVFEKYIPKYFNHARFLYKLHSQSIRNRNRNNRKPHIDRDVREMVRRNFTNEYEFYYFCKQRLYKQYLALQLENNLK